MDFIKTYFDKKVADKEEEEMRRELQDAKNEWSMAVKGFEQVTDELLVDYFTFRIMACQARYQYFLKLAKDKGLKCGEENLKTFHTVGYSA